MRIFTHFLALVLAGSTVAAVTREQYVGGMRLHARDTTLQTRIVYLDIVGTIAQARTEISIGTRTFVDFFNLLKTSDGWFIVDKAATQVPRGSTTPPQNVAPTRPPMPVLETGDRQPATPVERGASFGT